MKIRSSDISPGQDLKKMRAFVHANEMSFYGFEREDVIEHFGADITDHLLAKRFIKQHKQKGKFHKSFEFAKRGIQLGRVRLIPRLPRAKAETMVVELVARAHAINQNNDLLFKISKITVFGSYLTDSKDLGDIDVDVEIVRKIECYEKFGELAVKHALLRAPRLLCPKPFCQTCRLRAGDYARREVRVKLKHRNRWLHMVDGQFHRIEPLKTPTRVIFAEAENDE